MAVLLFCLSTNHDDRPICVYTVDMLFNIVGHKIDGNYESCKYMGQTTARDRLASGRRPSFQHPGVRRFFWCCSNNAHIFFIFHIFLKQLLTH